MQDLKILTDEQLVKLYKKRVTSAFDEIYARYKEHIMALAHRFKVHGKDADDLVQECSWGLYNAVNTYNEQRENASTFKTYAYCCIKSCILNAAKSAASKRNEAFNDSVSYETISEFLEQQSTAQSPEDDVIDKERLEELLTGIEQNLTDFEIEVFNLHVQGVKYKEIAQKLGKPAKSVDNAIQRIKKKAKRL